MLIVINISTHVGWGGDVGEVDISALVGWRRGKGEVDTVCQPLLGGE
jgi:hypothetical protein